MTDRTVCSPPELAAPYTAADPCQEAARTIRLQSWRDILAERMTTRFHTKCTVVGLPDGDNMLNIHETVEKEKAQRMHDFADGFETAVNMLLKP